MCGQKRGSAYCELTYHQHVDVGVNKGFGAPPKIVRESKAVELRHNGGIHSRGIVAYVALNVVKDPNVNRISSDGGVKAMQCR